MEVAVDRASGRPSASPRRVEPTNDYIEFSRSEIEQSIPTRFEQQALRHASRLAVSSPRFRWTYDQLNRAANRVAHAILAQQRPGQVALLFEHDALALSALLGVLKAGRTYVPLDASAPRARNAYMLEDSQASILLTDDLLLAEATALTGANLQLLNIDHLANDLPDQNPGVEISANALAFILYTSGSTGQPKGVVDTHRNMLHLVMDYTNGLHLCAEDRISLIPRISFSGCLLSLYGSLLTGASVHLYDLEQLGFADIGAWVIREQITIFCSGEGFRTWSSQLTSKLEIPSLRMIFCGSSTLYRHQVERYQQYFPDSCLLVNSLAATEQKLISRYLIDKQIELTSAVVPVGHPSPDSEVLLLDDDGEPVEAGEVGEIAVRSRFTSPGYWRRPELTAQVFLPDPADPDLHLYRTGDLGRRDPDGCLHHIGRKDFQVKIRGHRVEVGEVEAALLELSGIADAVVVARDDDDHDSPGGTRLVAYVTPTAGAAATVAELRAHLQDRLPPYMVPSRFVTLERLPRNRNGKVDRSALPEPGRGRPELANSYAAPRTPYETLLADLWSALLGLDQIGVHDNFLELGGDSLLATRLIARIRATLQVELPLTELLRAPTVADQAIILLRLGITANPAGGLARLLDELEDAADLT